MYGYGGNDGTGTVCSGPAFLRLQCNRETDLEAFLDERQEPVTDYDEGMVRRLIERITVFEDHLEFEFKCGLETEVQM